MKKIIQALLALGLCVGLAGIGLQTTHAASTKDASAKQSSVSAKSASANKTSDNQKPEPKVTETKADKGTKKRLVAYLEITNDQTGKGVKYEKVYAEKDSTGTALDKEKSGWQGMTYNDIPSFPRYDLTPAEIKAKVAAVGITSASSKQTWSVTEHRISYE